MAIMKTKHVTLIKSLFLLLLVALAFALQGCDREDDIRDNLQEALAEITITDETEESLTLPGEISGYDITWSVDDDTYIDSTGQVNRPDYDTGDIDVVLTATVSEDDIVESREFPLTILAWTETEILDILHEAAGEFDPTAELDADITLPETLADFEADWSVDDDTHLDETGRVVRPRYTEGDQEVTLYLTLSKGSVSDTFSYEITVLAYSEEEVLADMDEVIDEFVIESETQSSFSLPETVGDYQAHWSADEQGYLTQDNHVLPPGPGEDDVDLAITLELMEGDIMRTEVFTVKLLSRSADFIADEIDEWMDELSLPDETDETIELPLTAGGYMIDWSSDEEDLLDEDNNLQRPSLEDGDRTVTLTATVSAYGHEAKREFTVTMLAYTEEEVRETLQEALATVEIDDEITSSINLPRLVETFAADWSVSVETHLDRFGNLERPTADEGDQEVVLTLTLKKEGIEETRDFPLTLLAKTEPEILAELNDALESLDIDETIESSFYLPKTVDGFAATWEVTPDHLLADDNRLWRPDHAEGDTDATITVTLESDGFTATKDFDVHILAYTEDEEQAVALFLDAIKDITWVGESVAEDLELPSSWNDVTIDWQSLDTSTISDKGSINPPLHRTGDLEVYMRASMLYGDIEKDFHLPVTIEALSRPGFPSSRTKDFINLAEEYLLDDAELTVYTFETRGLPYVDVMEFLQLLDGGEKDGAIIFEVLDIEIDGDLLIIDNRVVYDSELYEDTSYTFIINFADNYAVTNQYGFFTSFQQATQTDFGQDLRVMDYEEQLSDPVVFDFEHYRMNMVRQGGRYLMPLHLANLFFSGSMYDVFFNGDAVYGFDTYQRNDPEVQEALLDSSYAGRNMTDNMLFSTYNFLVFSFDHFYGLREDQGVETYHDVFKPEEIKTQGEDHYDAILDLTLALDDLHTSFGMTGHYAPDFDPFPLDIMDVGRRTQQFYFRLWNIQDDYLADRRQLDDPSTLDADSVVYYDDGRVARIPVSAFDDSIPEKFGEVMEAIDEQGTVEEIIVDLTYNTGGIVGTMIQILGYMTDEHIPMHRWNAGDDSKSTLWYSSDVQARKDYEWHILSSPITYSAGNMMVQIAKEMGIASIIGQDSAGGAASITTNILPSGAIIVMSSPNVATNENYESIEYGITVDAEIEFHDLLEEDAILEAIESLKD